jgi:hypothetical protein
MSTEVSIGELYDIATANVDTVEYMNAFVEEQLTPFERALMAKFFEEHISLTLESLQGFIDQPSDYGEGQTKDVVAFVDAWEEHLWDAINEGGEETRRNALQAILHECDHMWVNGPVSFRRALMHTATVYKAEELHDALTRYQVEKVEQRFAELAGGEGDE